jgi:hypothetical protein
MSFWFKVDALAASEASPSSDTLHKRPTQTTLHFCTTTELMIINSTTETFPAKCHVFITETIVRKSEAIAVTVASQSKTQVCHHSTRTCPTRMVCATIRWLPNNTERSTSTRPTNIQSTSSRSSRPGQRPAAFNHNCSNMYITVRDHSSMG